MRRSKWDKFSENLRDHLHLRRLIQTWFHRAGTEKDPFGKFIYLWISFDAFATNYSEEEWPKAVRENIQEDSFLIDCYASLMKSSIFAQKIGELQKLCPVYDTRKRFLTDPRYSATINHPNNFKEVIEVIYKIRNNLFHGGKNPDVNRDEELVSLAFTILEELSTFVFMKANIV